MTFTKYGTSSWELKFQSQTQVMLLHGITEKHKKYEVSDSQALFRSGELTQDGSYKLSIISIFGTKDSALKKVF